jgi:phosphomannomutase
VKRLIVFDLDGTLAKSKSSVDAEMSGLLHSLLGIVRVAIISGGAWPQFEAQVLAGLPRDPRLTKMSLLPTCGTRFLAYDGAWKELYSEDLSAAERAKIIEAMKDSLAEAGFRAERVWGDTIEDRGSQVTLSALGQQAPLDAKVTWDPDFAKRKKIKALLDARLPEFSVRMGGATSIDVTRHGIDKAYGLDKLRDILGVALTEMLFVGDALFAGGNDHPAREAGVACIQVRDPDETKRVIETLLACLEGLEDVAGPRNG